MLNIPRIRKIALVLVIISIIITFSVLLGILNARNQPSETIWTTRNEHIAFLQTPDWAILGSNTSFSIVERELTYGILPFSFINKEIDVIVGNCSQYQLPLDLMSISNFLIVKDKISLSNEALRLLRGNGFVVIRRSYDNFEDAYINIPKGIPRLVTVDFILHEYHTFYQYLLFDFEIRYFIPWLNIALKTLLNKSISLYVEYKNVTSAILKEALLRNIAYFGVLTKLMDPHYNVSLNGLPNIVQILINAELEYIENCRGIVDSPLFGHLEDYSQYKPRGYYTFNETMKRYFKTMMYMGRMFFELEDPYNDTRAMVQTIQASAITKMVYETMIGINGQEIPFFEIWSKIYNITSFFVGTADDLTPIHYNKALEIIFGESWEIQDLIDTNRIESLINLLLEMNPAKISSVGYSKTFNAGMRLMGQRFIIDSYIFQNLVHSAVKWRFMPTALDILNVFGYSNARYLMKECATQYPEYSEIVESLSKQIERMNVTEWTKNLYNGWLYVLKALLKEDYTGYPTFMQTDAWKYEKMNSFLGSWTELRHDTILYAKQSYTLVIAEPPYSQVLHRVTYPISGYVEPLPLVWSRLLGLINMTIKGLDSLGVLSEYRRFSLSKLYEKIDFLLDVSIKILKNEKLTESEIRRIYYFGNELKSLVSSLFPKTQQQDFFKRFTRSILVADVHTDPNEGNVLEEAVGYVFWILAVFINQNNELEIAIGPVFSYYEFIQPMNNRLTDEEWEQMLNTNPPDLPEWTQAFIP